MDKQINITEGGLPVETWVSDNTGQSPNTFGMDNYLLTPEEIKEALENLVIEQPQWDYDNGQFVNGEEYQKATAIQQAVLSKLLAAAPDVWEKVYQYLYEQMTGGNTVLFKDLVNGIHNLYLPAILAAADEADSKWVTALKPFGITVDSPEALAGAVQVLMEESAQSGCAAMESAIHADLDEARREERERIFTELDNHTLLSGAYKDQHMMDWYIDLKKGRSLWR